MADNPNQPREYDAVQGSQAPIPVGGVVLGGLEGVKRHFLASPVVEVRVAALSEALKHGHAGLDLVIQARHEARLVEDAAYRLLLTERTHLSVQQALQDDYLHQLFECFFNIWNTSSVGAVALSPDRQTLASSDRYETIRLWSLQTGQLLHTFEDKDSIKFLAFSLDGQILISSNMYYAIKLWSVKTGNLLHTLEDSNYIEIESIDFGSDGESLIVADARGTTKLWSMQTGQLLQSIDSDEDEEDEYEIEEAYEYEVADNFYEPYINNPAQYTENLEEIVPDQLALPSVVAPDPVFEWLEGIKAQLASPSAELRIAALSEALKHGQERLDVVIEFLKNETGELEKAAYLLLQESTYPNLSEVPQEYTFDEYDALISIVGVDYLKLRNLLLKRHWKEAEEETVAIMLKVCAREREGFLRVEDIEKFPFPDLRTIDQLWVKYSNGRFGFSVQTSIWQSIGGNQYADWEAWCRYGESIGWYVKGSWLWWNDLTFTLKAPIGHLPRGGAFMGWGLGDFWTGCKMLSCLTLKLAN
jgi:hypothetical protein